MGTWVRIKGQINIDTGTAYHRFDENPHVYEYYVNMQKRIEKWIRRAFNKHLRKGYAVDCGCNIAFFDRDQCYRNHGYDFFERRIELSEYEHLTVVLQVWDRNGDFNNGSAFIEDVFNKLRTNGFVINDNTFVAVGADYSPVKLIYTTDGLYTVDFEKLKLDNSKKLRRY